MLTHQINDQISLRVIGIEVTLLHGLMDRRLGMCGMYWARYE